MSPGNSYFKDDAVRHLLREIVGSFGRAAVFVPDIPAIATYRALGYPENRARAKAVLKGNSLKNRVQRICGELDIPASSLLVIDWQADVENDPVYIRQYELVRGMYESNVAFATAADAATAGVLEGAGQPSEGLKEATATAVHYLLSELAFLEFSPRFFGVDSVAYVYHRPWPVYEEYIAGKFDGQVRDGLSFYLLPMP